MNYSDFKRKGDHIDNMLIKLGIIDYTSRYVKINYEPDYDILPYSREDSEYYFKNSWSFTADYQIVLGADSEEPVIYSYHDIENLLEEYGLEISFDPEDFSGFLEELSGKRPELLAEIGEEPEFDQFKLHCMRITHIENNEKQIAYDGSYFGQDTGLDDFSLYTELTLKIVPHFNESEYYKTLIGEAYLLFLQGNLKLSSFILFTAFDNFVNRFYGNPAERVKLEEKYHAVFIKKFGNLKRHNIYSQIAGNFRSFEYLRNMIAHGQTHEQVTYSQLKELFVITLTMILVYNFDYKDFQKLLSGITEQ